MSSVVGSRRVLDIAYNNNNNNDKQTFQTRQITEICREGARSNVTNRH